MRSLIIGTLLLAIAVTLGAVWYLSSSRTQQSNSWDKYHLAEAMYESGDFTNAIQNLLPVVEEGQKFEGTQDALYLLGQIYAKTEPPKALEVWKQYTDTYPEGKYFAEAKLNLADAMMEQDAIQARALYQEVADADTGRFGSLAMVGIAKTFEQENNINKARELYYGIIESSTDYDAISGAKDRLTEINTKTLWTPALDEFGQLYVVQKGDSPIRIAGQFKTTAWYVKEANNMPSNNLQIGKRLKVPKEPFYVVVDKDHCRLNLLTESGKFVKWYPVGIGEESWKTPAGEYEIINKEENPVWYKPGGGVIPSGDPENALGTRWMGIGNSLGIHGTNDPSTIGFRKSAGCIRMHNEDVEELYKLITYKTRVVIEEGNSGES